MRHPLIIDGRNLLDPARVRARRLRVRGDRPRRLAARRAPGDAPSASSNTLVEALILAGGKAERLGDAAQGRPKPLVHVAGRPLAAYQVARLAEAGVARVIVACAAGSEAQFEEELGGLGPEIVAVGEPEPLGRGGGLRLAASQRQETGPLFALNGDELLGVDLARPARAPRSRGAAATIVVSQVRSPFGVVDVDGSDTRQRASARRRCCRSG